MGATEFLNRGVRDRKRAVLGWSLGFVAYIAIIVASFPTLEGSDELDTAVEDYQEALKNIFGISGIELTSGPGYLDSQLFNLVLAIGTGSKTVAGEEEAGRLELLFAYPVRWRDGVLMKGIAVAVEIVVVSLVSFLTILGLGAFVDLDVGLERLAGAVLAMALLALLHGWLAVAVGAARPGKSLAIAFPPGWRPSATSSTACTRRPAGSSRSAFSRASGGSACPRCPPASGTTASWSWQSCR